MQDKALLTCQESNFAYNVERFSGYAVPYDAHRPSPPKVLIRILTQLAQTKHPQLVVDLGSGTGISSRLWADSAERVIGIEPSPDMRCRAETHSGFGNVSYRAGLSHQIGLPNDCACIVTCSQSLHWMEPLTTFSEVARILRPEGVFAAYDCDWPPVMTNWEAEVAYNDFVEQVLKLEKEHGLNGDMKRWSKSQHLARMQASGCFHYVKEITLHHVEVGNAERLVGLALSQGSAAILLKHGLNEAEIGLDILRAVASRTLGAELKPWYFSYRVRIGIV